MVGIEGFQGAWTAGNAGGGSVSINPDIQLNRTDFSEANDASRDTGAHNRANRS
jgi:hypothetical protein